MASTVSEPSTRNDIELGPVTHWPTVYAAVGVAAVVFLGIATVAVLAAIQPAAAPAPQVVAVIAPAPPARPRGVVVKPRDPAPPAAADVVPAPEPEPAEVAPSPPPAPVPVATAVTPLIRVSQDAAPDPEPPAPPIVPPPQFALFDELQAYAHEIDLDAVPGTSAKILSASRTDKPSSADDGIVEIIAKRPDLAGLPVRGALECKTPAAAARKVQETSRLLRREESTLLPTTAPSHYDRSDQGNPGAESPFWEGPDRSNALLTFLGEQKDWPTEENASTLVQMLQAEDAPVRLQLTKLLSSVKGRPAGEALARLALFDLTPAVRAAATAALKDRPAKDYRRTLLEGFRHPWPPVADHAAEALAALKDGSAVPELERLIDLPDPSAPVLNEQKRWVKAELVKVNHLRNCLLCHPVSSSPSDLVRAPVPKPGEPLPRVYYDHVRRTSVHADVTYLRQDFSLVESVREPGKWPLDQRFDYLIRRRPLTDDEVTELTDFPPAAASSYPQRAAVRRAIDALTGGPARRIEKVGLGP